MYLMRRVVLPGCILLSIALGGFATYTLPPARQARAAEPPPAPPQFESTDARKDALVEPAASFATMLSPQKTLLRDRIRSILGAYYRRPVNARDHTPWEVFHWIIAYNVDAQLYTHGPGGATENAVGWMCYNRPCHGQQLLALENGRIAAQRGVGLEGHTGQFLAILGQSRVMADYPMQVGGKQFVVADLVETQKLTCQSGTELTFQLIGLAHYLDLKETWRNSAGEEWSIPRLINEEIAKPIHGSACGGTHRLMGLSYAVKKRQRSGLPIDGEYRRAQVYVNDYIQFTLRMQNPDGSFSTEWFNGRGAKDDIDRRVQTTGHILEWLVFASSNDQLEDPRIVKAVDYLSKLLASDVHREWKIGPLGHALRALSLYDRRVFKPLDEQATAVARRPATPPRTPSGMVTAQRPPATNPRQAKQPGPAAPSLAEPKPVRPNPIQPKIIDPLPPEPNASETGIAKSTEPRGVKVKPAPSKTIKPKSAEEHAADALELI